MNKKLWIGALVAGTIMFLWQFMVWSVIELHKNTLKHTENQDVIMEVLESNLEDGEYFLPNLPPTATQSEKQKYMEDSVGKAWAQINYHSEMKMSMGMNMFRGWVIDFIVSLLLISLLLKITNLTFFTALISSLSIGIMGYLSINYTLGIWFEKSTITALIDAIIQWGLVGIWLGWYLNSKKS